MNRKLALNFRKHSGPDLITDAYRVVNKLTDNEFFPEVKPLLAPILETANQLQHAVVEASDGDSLKIIIKNDMKEKLIALLRELGDWIEKHSNGDDLAMVSSGFMLAKPRKEISLQNPVEFIIIPGKNMGEIIMQVKRVNGAKAYIFQYTPDPLTDDSKWKTINSTKRKIVITQLPLGVKFFFRMAAIGARNQVVYTKTLFRYIA
ncbi:hypothetical protein A4D02_32305 [Niastella koreensis]|uniref:Fibronectin type III domain-containing protein n=2 Tax=Niastella koreensis TaxID=354356 RepID=G8TBZ2_NIAKG|nr:hypothetical protein [Niastella koreensis]AEV99285.1 hypothetical protein Niako_2955 [Niastella koreensis GR20-10]OQP46074.1 hypothetical protein A4D02_32305 [Niastella koreensis]